MRILCVGFHVESFQAFEFLIRNYDVVGMMTLTEQAAAKRSGVFDFAPLCKEHQIPLLKVKHINHDTSIEIIQKLRPDLLIVLGWSQLLNNEVLSIPTIGTIGAHASMLPEMRGSAPINWAIIKGMTKTGNTLMWLNIGVDTGKIIDQYEFEIDLYDSCKTLYDKVAVSNKVMLERSLPFIQKSGKIGIDQVEDGSPVLPRRKPEHGLINFNQKCLDLYNFVRAITRPYPGAFFMHNDQKVIVWRASYLQISNEGSKPGDILDVVYGFHDQDCGVVISCADGGIIISEVEVDNQILVGKALHQFFNDNVKK